MIFAVLPGDIDDPGSPSGGNRYDREICNRLTVRELQAHGAWPEPSAGELAALGTLLAGLPDGAPVLIDGLVASCSPTVMEAHAARLRLVVLVHMPLASAGEGRALRAAAAIIATSGWTSFRLIDLYGLSPGLVHVALPGVDPAPVARGSGGAGSLLCVAVVGPHKGHDVLVEALARVADRPWTCVCAGSVAHHPAFVATLRERIDTLGLGDRITFTGPRPVADLYAAADLLVHPSLGETYGMVAAEALARGVPVLGTTAQGLPDAIGVAAPPGWLVPPGDPGALAAALRNWFDDAALRERLRAGALARRETLTSWDGTAHVIEAVFRHAAGN